LGTAKEKLGNCLKLGGYGGGKKPKVNWPEAFLYAKGRKILKMYKGHQNRKVNDPK